MVKYTWHNQPVPSNIKVKQVYGIVFSHDGRVLLMVDDNKYKLAGGKPERKENYIETLSREYQEELNIELEQFYYLGYLLVKEKDIPTYAQVRLIAKIKTIGPKHVDIATGKIYDRQLVIQDHVKDYLKYKEKAGNIMIDDAISLALKKYTFDDINEHEEFI